MRRIDSSKRMKLLSLYFSHLSPALPSKSYLAVISGDLDRNSNGNFPDFLRQAATKLRLDPFWGWKAVVSRDNQDFIYLPSKSEGNFIIGNRGCV